MDQFDRLQGFLDPQSRPNREKDSNLTLHGKSDGQDGFEINVKINCNSFELIGGSNQVNLGPFESINQLIISPCTSSRPKIVDSKSGGLEPLNRGLGHVQSTKGSKQPKSLRSEGQISATGWSL